MVYSVVCAGVTECSNSLEDEEDTELLPQALVYKQCRQRIYGLLLLLGQDRKKANTWNGLYPNTNTCIYIKKENISIWKLENVAFIFIHKLNKILWWKISF